MNTAGFSRGLLAASIFLGAPSIAASQPSTGLRIVVTEAHYVLGEKAYDDLNAVERVVRDAAPAFIALDACSDGTATALKAAAHRFSHLPLRIRVGAADVASCATTSRTVHASHRIDAGHRGIDAAEVERYWLRVMP